MLIRITIRSNIIAGAIFKILSRSFYAEILALQGFPAGLRDSYFILDKSGYPEFRNNQTFSIAGSRKGFGDPRGTLFFELARLAEARKPSYLLFENVPGLLSHDGGRTFATILNTLDRLGYGVEWQWSSEGKDIYTCLPILRTALGHDRITTTEKYLRLVPEAYMEVTEPFNDRFHTITEVLCNEE